MQWGGVRRRKWGKEMDLPIVSHSRWRFRSKQLMPGLPRPLNRPLVTLINLMTAAYSLFKMNIPFG